MGVRLLPVIHRPTKQKVRPASDVERSHNIKIRERMTRCELLVSEWSCLNAEISYHTGRLGGNLVSYSSRGQNNRSCSSLLVTAVDVDK